MRAVTDQKIEAFLDDPQTETLFLIGEIGDTDTELALDIYTRNQRNAMLALEDLKAEAIGLRDEMNLLIRRGDGSDGTVGWLLVLPKHNEHEQIADYSGRWIHDWHLVQGLV